MFSLTDPYPEGLPKMVEMTDTEKAQAWQTHRKCCVELAIQAGVGSSNIIEVAKLIDSYIVTKSELEKVAK